MYLNILLLILLVLFPTNIAAQQKNPQAQILFINQVRGTECCDKGNFENLTNQINKFVETKIPSFFTIRYDALKNPQYLSYLKSISLQYPNIIKLGLLLEITPDLAKNSQVSYHGTVEKWYEAQNIFSIGYTFEENTKIADTIFNKFYENFGYFPELTTGWMIETQTLNYIHDKYKIKIHQITREQWQTDSYTIYGGPAHYPYPANANWAIIPDYKRQNAPLIVRQTVIDPLMNYGDNINSYTSQPNDYMRDKKKFDYFKNLIDQAINQPNTGFALLGLENSMDQEFNNEYLNQIDYVKTLIDNKQAIIPDASQLISFWAKQKITIYQGKDLINNSDSTAYWVTTPTYRARIRTIKNETILTDLRIFNTNYVDPYTNTPAKKLGFWIVPYLIDGSRTFNINNDNNLNITSIKLPPFSKLKFNEGNIIIKCPECKLINYNNLNPQSHPIKYETNLNGFSLKWMFENKPSQTLSYSCQSNQCQIKMSSIANLLTDQRIKQYPYLFPEPINRIIDIDKTIIYSRNQFGISGQNPIRIVIMPVDTYKFPIKINEPIEIITKERIDYNQVSHGLIQYVDIVSDKPISLNPIIKIQGKELRKVNVYFAPDCKRELKYCISNPIQLWWYINSFIGDKYRLFILGEKQ